VDTFWNSELLSFISTLVRQHYSKTIGQNEDGYIDIATKQGGPTNHTYKTACFLPIFIRLIVSLFQDLWILQTSNSRIIEY
jgi:hypothetical protein